MRDKGHSPNRSLVAEEAMAPSLTPDSYTLPRWLATIASMKSFIAFRFPMTLCAAALLAACSSVGVNVGISVPIIPGVSVGVGVGSGGVSAGASVGKGPVSAGVGVNQSGRVSGSVGVGTSVGVGGASVGVGVGSSTVIYDPNDPNRPKSADPLK